MKFQWHIEQKDIQLVQKIVAEQRNRDFFIRRLERNVTGPLPQLGRNEIWRQQMMCLLTSQQRSGPGSPICSFLTSKPFRLQLKRCQEAKDVKRFVNSALLRFGGVRFTEKVASHAASNFQKLEEGGWTSLLEWLDKLKAQRLQSPNPLHYRLERQSASYMTEYHGFGPKQSRNFWQALGLTRYEFVLDSRIIRWLKKSEFPIPLSSSALGDEQYYAFLSDILRELCLQAGVLPCLLDAAVFASYDQQEWPSNFV